MRRPTLCGEVRTEDDAHDGVSGAGAGVGRLSRVRRLLTDTLLPGRRSGHQHHDPALAKSFGSPLRDQLLNKEGVPVVVAKICSYLENNGLQCSSLFLPSAGSPRVAERLRASLDLERTNDVHSAALLLRAWLQELPEPLVPGPAARELLTAHRKVREEAVGTWRQSVRYLLCALPEANLRLLRHVLRFLDRYRHHQQQQLPQVAAVFAPLLVLKGLEQDYVGSDVVGGAEDLTKRLIQDHAALFHQWLLDHPDCPKQATAGASCKKILGSSLKGAPDSQNSHQQRKRKERNESANSNQSLERKVIRSSSEERHVEVPVVEGKNESIRRVSSHEDFSRTKQQTKLSSHVTKFSTVVELSDQPAASAARVAGTHPLQECNHKEKDIPQLHAHVFQESSPKEKENDVKERPVHQDYLDEHEKRRSSERVSRSIVLGKGRRAGVTARRRRPLGADASPARAERTCETSCKENEDVDKPIASHFARPSTLIHLTSEPPRALAESAGRFVDEDDPDGDVDSLSDESRPESSHSFLQLHPPERERSPSPSVSPCTPPLDLTTLHQSVDGSEPVASRAGWDFAQPPRHGEDDCGRGVLLSPRNSTILTRRVYMDHNVPPSPPGDHLGSCLPGPGPAVDADDTIRKFNKQISSIKKKLKRYEEGFEKEFGYRPSQSDKMANKDIKQLYAELSYLRKELKQLKENPVPAVPSQSEPRALWLGLVAPAPGEASQSGVGTGPGIVDTVADVERRLRDKRRVSGRPESLDEMTGEQHAAEKLALQKALLLLEKLCGRASSKQDREIVRPLYDRYRQLKRIVARAASSKLKDSINELETIHEHEAMEFTPSASLIALSDSGAEVQSAGSSAPPSAQLSVEEASDSQTSSSDSLGENLHALPLSDLVLQLTQTREEKKRLRRVLREQEEQFQLQTGRRMQREDRIADGTTAEIAGAYVAYKQVKAKLRLLEALVAKLR